VAVALIGGSIAFFMLLAILLVGYAVLTSPPSSREIARLKVEGQNIVDQIKSYKAKNGKYPRDLASVGITPPKANYGGWIYHVREMGPEGHYQEFRLKIGDSQKHGWSLSWTTKSRYWYLYHS
jgi:hypothetical protein